ncbi:MAG: hemerythrin family protein [Anaerolineales bacterium]|nr:hemerythrin family protein [Anaerolineales bacterium]
MYTPKLLQWDFSLTTGDEVLDNQHKYLIEILNKLGTAILDGYGKENIIRILGTLKFYADWHFGKEEQCMEAYHCPAADKNKRAHSAFIEKFNRYHKEYLDSGGSDDLALKIHESIYDWIVGHILTVDSELYPCIHKRPKPNSVTAS